MQSQQLTQAGIESATTIACRVASDLYEITVDQPDGRKTFTARAIGWRGALETACLYGIPVAVKLAEESCVSPTPRFVCRCRRGVRITIAVIAAASMGEAVQKAWRHGLPLLVHRLRTLVPGEPSATAVTR